MNPRLLWLFSLAIPLPLLGMYFYGLWQFEHYQFFVVLLLSLIAMFYWRWDGTLLVPANRLNVAVLLLGLFISFTACVLFSPWLGCLGFLLTFCSFCATHYEKPTSEGYEPISKGTLLYLSLAPWLCLRLPLNLDQKLTLGLQHLTARTSSYCLDLLSIPHQLSGVTFDMAGAKLFVEEACSGVQSLFSLLCVALIFLAWNRRPLILAPFYFTAAIFSAALLNIARVVAIAVAQDWYRFDLAHGWKHDLLGYSCLMVAILLLASFDRLFQFFFYPISEEGNPLQEESLPNPFTLAWNWLLAPRRSLLVNKDLTPRVTQKSNHFSKWWPTAILSSFLVIGWGATAIFGTQQALRVVARQGETGIDRHNSFWMPDKQLFASEKNLVFEGYEQTIDNTDIADGRNADIWVLFEPSKRLRHRVAISQPYDSFHDLGICYTGNGWYVDSRKVVKNSSEGENFDHWPFIFSSWFNDSGSRAYLTFSALDREGKPVAPPEESLSDLLRNRFSFGGGAEASARECLMFQVWTTLDSPLDSESQKELESLHLRLREIAKASFEKHLAK